MTYDELKAEANKIGYNLVKKREYISHKICKCGSRGSAWYDYTDGKVARFILCENCHIRTNSHISEYDAWKEWNKMQEE